MGPDYRVLVDKARKVSHTNYKRIYNEYPPTRILVQDVARVMQEATQSGGVRPYGVSLLIAGWDDGIEPETAEAKEGETEAEAKLASRKTGGILKGGPSLYQVDPSGSYFPWKATAIGKSSTSAKTFLEKRYNDSLELEVRRHRNMFLVVELIICPGCHSYCATNTKGDHRRRNEWRHRRDRYCWRASEPFAWIRRRRRSGGPSIPQAQQRRDRRLPDEFVRKGKGKAGEVEGLSSKWILASPRIFTCVCAYERPIGLPHICMVPAQNGTLSRKEEKT